MIHCFRFTVPYLNPNDLQTHNVSQHRKKSTLGYKCLDLSFKIYFTNHNNSNHLTGNRHFIKLNSGKAILERQEVSLIADSHAESSAKQIQTTKTKNIRAAHTSHFHVPRNEFKKQQRQLNLN